MQQVHMRQYDFTQFTHLGHNLLFAQFDLIKSGPVGGTGSALAWHGILSVVWFHLSA